MVQKLPSYLFRVSNPNHILRRFLPYFFRYAFPLNSDDFSVMAFFLQLHFYAYFTALLRLILSLFFRDISLKSQELLLYFRHISMNFSCLIFFVEMPLLVVHFISLIYSFIYSLLFVYLFVYFLIFISLFLFLIFQAV